MHTHMHTCTHTHTHTHTRTQQVWQFLGVTLPSQTEMRLTHKNENTWIKAREYKDSFHMHNKTREMLTEFFWPYNMRLASLLKDVRFLWQD